MADEASASSHSNSIRKKFHVFISFRGEDTRKTFTSHLYRAFSDKKINAYIDEESLKKGDEISPTLLDAIEESMISVVILSKDYASSRWCLDELNQIVQCNESHNQIVVPVFYDIYPSDVRKQQGSYSTAFAAHEERFKDQMDKVHQWRNSLAKVADLSGFHSSNFGSDAKLVETVVEDIKKKLQRILMLPSIDSKDLVGIEKRIRDVESKLNMGSSGVRILGFWGMGGIGKTTLARAVFDKFAPQFDNYCFLENVKEESKRHGLDRLQKKLFSNLLSEEKELNMISQFVKDRLRHTKVLIVLDDVDNVNQLEFLANDRDWFGPGSKIIITSRDMHVLKTIEADGIYEVEELNSDDSLRLFCSKAFRLSSPPRDYLDLSQRMVHYAKGIPLVLKVLGGHLYKKSIKQWESELDKLKKIPKNEVYEVLKISYDGLESDEKELFLDIACFFKGRCRDSVERILESYGTRYVDAGIPILIDKALITVEHTHLEMHELLQQMGWWIVRQESTNPGERSRLWLAEDVYEVLRYNTGTRAIQGISLKTYQREDVIQLEPGVFEKMYNLKYLKVSSGENCLNFPEGLKSLPDELRYLSWKDYPLKSLPSKFNPCNLIKLNLSWNKHEHLWDGVQNFANLKLLNLSCSKNLIQIPDLSRALKLEEIDLIFCECLENLPSSISKLESLQSLKLYCCQNFNKFPELPMNIEYLDMGHTSIKQVPSSIGRLFHLQHLQLFGCLRLEYLPETLKNLTFLLIERSGIRKLPSSISNLTGLTSLDLNGCKKLESLPPALSTDLLSWNRVSLDCTNVSEIPDWLFRLPVLEELSLSETGIKTIPASIKHSKLRRLYIIDCKYLEYLPELPVSIKLVHARGCMSLLRISKASIDTRSISILKKLTAFKEKPWSYRENYIEKLIFIDCSKLDHNYIISEFQIRALRSNFLPRPKKVKSPMSNFIDACSVCISFSRAEIPEWFDYQNNNGSSINMKLLPPQCYDKINFMGFASCIVVKSEVVVKSKFLPPATLFCDVRVQINNGQKCYTFMTQCYGYREDHSKHMLMSYFHTNEIDLVSAKEISFVFRIVTSSFAPYTYKVKRCGIRMLQVQDAVDFGIRITEYVPLKDNIISDEDIIIDEDEPSELQSVNLETNEPPPKRTKFSSSP